MERWRSQPRHICARCAPLIPVARRHYHCWLGCLPQVASLKQYGQTSNDQISDLEKYAEGVNAKVAELSTHEADLNAKLASSTAKVADLTGKLQECQVGRWLAVGCYAPTGHSRVLQDWGGVVS